MIPKKIVSTFDDGDDGWGSVGDGIIEWVAEDGNPDGFLSFEDLETSADDTRYLAPDKFLGDKALFYGGTLSYDLMIAPGADFDAEDLRITGGGIALYLELPAPGGSWTHYEITLDDNTNWRVGDNTGPRATEAQIRRVLSDISEIRIAAEFVNGPENGGIDNVSMTPAPWILFTSPQQTQSIGGFATFDAAHDLAKEGECIVFTDPDGTGIILQNRPIKVDALTVEGDTIEGKFVLENGVTRFTLAGSMNAGVTGNEVRNIILGSNGRNTLEGRGGKDDLAGRNGVDKLDGGAGDDSLSGGLGKDTLLGGDGLDTIVGDDGADSADGGGDRDFLFGREGEDTLAGGAGRDELDGGIGNDSLAGGADLDVFIAAAGNDTLDGGDGIDLVDFTKFNAPLVLALPTGGSGTVVNAGDTERWTSIEGVLGTVFGDRLTGNSQANQLSGFSGNDTLDGQGGRDTLAGSDGNDTIFAGDGNNEIDGGDEIDLADYSRLAVTGQLVIDLAAGRATLAAASKTDVLIQIESVIAGTKNDIVTGSVSANRIEGLAGNDKLDGAGGADTILGGLGDDTIKGGTGRDSLDGGAGLNTLSYDGETAGVSVNMIEGNGTDSTANFSTAIGGSGKDRMIGKGSDVIGLFGQAGDDTLIITGPGVKSRTEVSGGRDNDLISVGNNVEVSGDAGDDTIQAQGGTSKGGADNDRLEVNGGSTSGDIGNDTIIAGDASDNIAGGQGTDRISAGGGNDNVYGEQSGTADGAGAASDRIDGGNGDDVVFANVGPLRQSLTPGRITGVIAALDSAQMETLANTIFGGIGDDTVFGAHGADQLSGNDGRDTIAGLKGNDIIDGGTDSDKLFGGSGDDRLIAGYIETSIDELFGGSGIDTADIAGASRGIDIDMNIAGGGGLAQVTDIENIIGGRFDDIITGDELANRFEGGGGKDRLSGADGRDTLFGGAGDDTLHGGKGNDEIIGGANADTVDYARAVAGVRVELFTTQRAIIGSETDSLSDIENVLGSAFADTIFGDNANNVFDGKGGADSLEGGNGNDKLLGGSEFDVLKGGLGDDTLDGGLQGARADYADSKTAVTVNIAIAKATGEGTDQLLSIRAVLGSKLNDRITGGTQDETLNGGEGNDTIDGGRGNDELAGNKGEDLVSYADANGSVRVLLEGRATGGGGADELSGFEGAIGSKFGDILTGISNAELFRGGVGNDTIDGKAGRDTLDGGAGNDRLFGSVGADTLTGGADDDRFVFGGDFAADTVRDFGGNDSILLERELFSRLAPGSRLDASAFHIGESADTDAHRIIYDRAKGELFYDSNGAKVGGVHLFAKFGGNPLLTAADFYII